MILARVHARVLDHGFGRRTGVAARSIRAPSRCVCTASLVQSPSRQVTSHAGAYTGGLVERDDRSRAAVFIPSLLERNSSRWSDPRRGTFPFCLPVLADTRGRIDRPPLSDLAPAAPRIAVVTRPGRWRGKTNRPRISFARTRPRALRRAIKRIPRCAARRFPSTAESDDVR